jgi:hypothetical protein
VAFELIKKTKYLGEKGEQGNHSLILKTSQRVRVGDDQLDWDGPQVGQGTVPGENGEEYEVRYNHR